MIEVPKDVLKLSYSDIKTVKTRGVFQLVLEAPIEGMQEAMGLLGAPVPGNEVWVAVARLRGEGKAIEPEPDVALPPPKKGTLAQIAGILCGKPAFWRYLEAYGIAGEALSSSTDAAHTLRVYCGVNSRRELDTFEAAGDKFRSLRADFDLWLKGIDPAPASVERAA